MQTPLFPSDAQLDRLYDALYPAFESRMGDTMVRELAEDLADDPDRQWRIAVALQLVLDRIEGLA